jgi:phage-related protein
MAAWSLVFYTDVHNRSPVREFLDGLTAKQQERVLATLELLEAQGTRLREPHAKPLQEGLWELRTQVAGNAFRCLYFTWTGRRFVILHGFQNKTEKAPKREIEAALRRRADWLARHRENA